MAAATVVINEENTASNTVTAAISKSDFGSADAANLDPVANPIAQSSWSYVKWQQYHVTSLGTSSAIQNLKLYATAPGSGWTLRTNAHTVQATYNTNRAPFATPVDPVNTDQSGSTIPTTMPTTSPGNTTSGNLGCAGAYLDTTNGKILVGNATAAANCTSDWLGMQLACATPTAGGSVTVTYGYDEVAIYVEDVDCQRHLPRA